jgi:hypothetical protein
MEELREEEGDGVDIVCMIESAFVFEEVCFEKVT